MTGQNVRQFREGLMLTQRQLAALLDVTTKTVSAWENDHRVKPLARVTVMALEFLLAAQTHPKLEHRLARLVMP